MNHIIYHDNCTDGFGAAYIAAKALSNKLEDWKLIPAKYGDDWADLIGITQPEDVVYILDFSFSPEELLEICSTHGKVVWLDHHKTAIDAWIEANQDQFILPKNLTAILDLERSGTGITWDYFHPQEPRPPWVDYIEDRDLWKFQWDETKHFNAGINLYDRTIQQWDRALLHPHDITNQGETALRVQEQHVKSILKDKIDILICGQKGLAVNCTGAFASDVGHELCKLSGTFGATWYQSESGDIKFSLRSEGSYNVAELAKRAGKGGGHVNAAGFTTTISKLMEYLGCQP